MNRSRPTNGSIKRPTFTLPDVHRHARHAIVVTYENIKSIKSFGTRSSEETDKQQEPEETGRRVDVALVAVNDDARVERQIGRVGAPPVVRVRVPRVVRAQWRVAVAGGVRRGAARPRRDAVAFGLSAAAGGAQGARPAAGYLEVLQHTTHAIQGHFPLQHSNG